MSFTIKQAMYDESDEPWRIKGKLISRQIFTMKKDGILCRLLKILLADEDGNIIEIKTWSEKKAFCVYRKFEPNETILITGNGEFREPNRSYSMAKCGVTSRWWITDERLDFRSRNYIHCLSNISRYRDNPKKPANFIGIFLSYVKGNNTFRRDSRGDIVIQGYYVKFSDDSGQICQALVWHTIKHEKNNFALFNAKEGKSLLLLPFAREQDEQYADRTPGVYMITSTYPPVIDPPCVDPAIVRQLKSNQ